MQELYGQTSLLNDQLGLLFGEGDSAIESVVQILTLKMLLYYEKVQTILENIEHSDYVWMPRIRQNLKLSYEEIIEDGLLR